MKHTLRYSKFVSLASLALAFFATEFVAPRADGAESGGKRYAVLIGIDAYDDKNLTQLRYCAKDVAALADTLKRAEYDQIITLDTSAQDVANQPTRKNILDKVEMICAKAKENDVVFIAYSGHGLTLPSTNASYLCPRDLKVSDVAKTGVAVDAVFETLGACKAKRKLFVVDACRNIPDLKRNIATLDDGTTRDMPIAIDVNAEENQARSVTITSAKAVDIALLQSCSQGETSLENPDLGHGVFTYYLVEALSGKADYNHNGAVSILELQMYVDEKSQNFFTVRRMRVGQTVRFSMLQSSNFEVVPIGAIIPPVEPTPAPPTQPNRDTEDGYVELVFDDPETPAKPGSNNSGNNVEIAVDPGVQPGGTTKPNTKPRLESTQGVVYDLSVDAKRALWKDNGSGKQILEGFELCDGEFNVGFALNLAGGSCRVRFFDDNADSVVMDVDANSIEITQGYASGGGARGESSVTSFNVTRVYNNRGKSKFMGQNNSSGSSTNKALEFDALKRVEFEFSNSQGSVASLVITK